MLQTSTKYFLINSFTTVTLTYFTALNLNLEEHSRIIYVKLLIPYA